MDALTLWTIIANDPLQVAIEEQSPDIAQGVHVGRQDEDVGAGDQGMMFGYATDETPELMPLTVVLSHQLNAKMAELRRSGELAWMRPDSKTQVCHVHVIKLNVFKCQWCTYLSVWNALLCTGRCVTMRSHASLH